MVRTSEHNHALRGRAVRHYPSHANRRQGQALLLAVLLMVFAALLGSTFITVVAINLNQTARQEDKSLSQAAAQAGLLFANAQIRENGEGWRPERISPPPAPNDPEYDYYYTPMERAQGWARTTPHPTVDLDNDGDVDEQDDWVALENDKGSLARVFVKFPDPRQPSNPATPTYLMEVKPLSASDALTEGSDKEGMLRVTVVGLSQDNQNVYVTRKTYHSTATKAGAFSYANFTGNYNWQKKAPIQAQLETVGSNLVTVDDTTGFEPGMTIILQSSTAYATAIVQKVTGPKTIETRNAITGGPFIPGTVRAAGNLVGNAPDDGSAVAFDADGNGTYDTTFENTKTVVQNAGTGSLKSVYVGGGANVEGKIQLDLQTNVMPGRNDGLSVAGRIIRNSATAVVDNPSASSPKPLPDSNDIAAGGLTGAQVLVKDGVGLDSTNPVVRSQAVQPVTPPDLEARIGSYQELTKFADIQSGSPYGYGPGLYINNYQDVEKVLDGGQLRPLSVSDSQRLWLRKSFSASAGTGNAVLNTATGEAETGAARDIHKLCYPRLPAPTVSTTPPYVYPLSTGSLEQRGIRGWVSPTEFLPRGVQIDLRGDQGKIVITRDDRSDGSSAPDPSKAWRTASGGQPPIGNVYRMELDLSSTNSNTRTLRADGASTTYSYSYTSPKPFNGVIFAEGNVRVRGTLGTYTKGVTIVSLGNIYVEGSLVKGTGDGLGHFGHIALVARKNVVYNPTQIFPRLDGAQDRDIAAPTLPATYPSYTGVGGGIVTLASTATAFRVGDRIRLTNSDTAPTSISSWAKVVAISGNQLTLDSTPVGAPASGIVTILTDPEIVSGLNLPSPTPLPGDKIEPRTGEYFYNLARMNEAFVRNLRVDDSTTGTQLMLSLLHSGAAKLGYKMRQKANYRDVNRMAIREDTGNDGSLTQVANKKVIITTSGTAIPDYTLTNYPSLPEKTLKNLTDYYDALGSTNNWETNHASTLDAIAAYRIAGVGVRDTGTTQRNYHDDNVLIDTATTTTAGKWLPVPLTVSVGLFFGQNTTNLSYTPAQMRSWSIGSFLSNQATGLGTGYPTSEEIATVREDFYWKADSSTTPDPEKREQAKLQWTTRWRPDVASSVFTTTGKDNVLAMQRDYVDDAALPAYRLGGFKVEQISDLNAPAPFLMRSGSSTWNYKPGMDLAVEATIYAHEGSWFIIPAPLQATNTFLDDYNANTATQTAIRATKATSAATEYRRLNYKLTVTGTIVQNRTPTGMLDYDNEKNPDGYAYGAVRLWSDALAYPANLMSDGTTVSALTDLTTVYNNGRGKDWTTVAYQVATVPTDKGLQLPASTDSIQAS